MHTNRSRTIFHVMLLASLLATLLGSAAYVQPARADIITVTSTADSGPGTLRQAVLDAVSGDTINFSVSGTITLISLISITKNLTIVGPGEASLTINGGDATRIFDIGANTVSISGLTITDGFSGGSEGGGIRQLGGSLTLNSVTIRDSQTLGADGGGIYQSGGALTVSNSRISGGTALHGGGIMVQNGPLTVANSTISGNSATSGGGGIYHIGNGDAAHTLVVMGSTFSGNSAPDGGGIYPFNSTSATIANSTFSANSAASTGGAMINFVVPAGSMTVVNSTFSGNSAGFAGGGIFNFGTLNLVNNILANSPSGGDCIFASGAWGTVSNNLIESGTCPFTTNLDPSLGPLANNGGTTETFALLTGSPAIDTGDNAACAAPPVNNLDQRGVSRPADGDGNGTPTCDMGAFEAPTALEASTTTISADSPEPSVTGQSVNVSVTVTGAGGTPGGTVNITGADTNCSITLAGGSGSCNAGFSSTGVKTLTATYTGDTTYGGSQDTESHTVNPADTSTTITADSPDPSAGGGVVSVSYTVAVVSPGSGAPTGNVTVGDGVDSCTGTAAAGSCNLTLMTPGSRTLTATYAGDSNFNGSSDTEAHTVDTSAPQVGSVTRADASPTNAASVNFTVTFSEAVTGVGAADFTLTTTGSLSGASVSGVTGSGTTYTVSVNTGSGDGTLRLDVVDDDTIVDAAGNPLAGGYTSGESYTVDKTAPTVASSVRASPNPTNAASVNFTVTFSEAVTGVNVADFALTTTGSLSGASVSGVTGSGTTYTVNVNTGSGNGTLRLDVVDDDTVVDAAGNPLAGGYTGGESYTVDRTAPTVVSSVRASSNPTRAASVNFTVTFSEAVTGVGVSDFALTTTGSLSGASVSGVTGSGTTYTVSASTGSGDGTLRLDVVDDDTILDAVGNMLGAGFTGGESYTVDKTAPTVLSSVRANPNPTHAASVNFTVTFSEAVTGVGVSDFALSTTGSLAATVISGVAGSGTTYTVSVNTGSGNGTLRLDVLDDDTIVDAAGNPLSGGYTGGESYTVDKTAPTVLSSVRASSNPTHAASVDFTVTFSEAVTGVGVSDFALTTTGSLSGASVSGVTGSGTTYTVSVSTGSGDGTLRLDVVDDDTIVDAAGNPLAGGYTGGESYTVDKTAPTVVSSVRASPNPTRATIVDFTVTFSEAVTGVNVADVTLATTGSLSGVSVSGVSGSGTTYTVSVSTGSGDGTLRLDVVDDDTVVDAAGNPLAGGYTGGESYTVDKTAPTVVSSVRADPNPTRAASVDFTVTFSEAVTGVNVTDFTISTTGSLAGTVVSGVTGSGTTYTVSVSTGSGAGNLRLDVVDDDTIVDAVSNPLAGGYTGGEVYEVGFYYTLLPIMIKDSALGGR